MLVAMAIFNKFVKEGFYGALYGGLGGLILGGGYMGKNMLQGYKNFKNFGGVSSIYGGVEINEKTTAKDVLEQLNNGKTMQTEAVEGDAQFAIKESKTMGKVAFLDGKRIQRQKGESVNHAIRRYFNETFKNRIITVEESQDNVKLDQIGKYLYPGEAIGLRDEKRAISSILDEIIEIGTDKQWSQNLLDENGNVKNHAGLDCDGGFNYYDTKFAVDNSGVIYGGRVIARIDKNGRAYFYDIDKIREVGYQDENEFYPVRSLSTSLEDSLPQNGETVNSNDMQSFGDYADDFEYDEEYAQGVLDAARSEMEAIPEATRKMMDFYSKFANVRFIVGDTDALAGKKAAGAYVNSSDVILLDFDTVQDSNEVARKIVNHELTHSAERSKHYDVLKEYAFSHMFNESNTKDSAIVKKIERYGKRGVTLGTKGAEAELVAEYMGKLMSSPEAVNKMAMENKPLAKNVLDSLVETYKKVTTYFKDKEAYEARYALSDIEQGIRLFEKALKTRTSVSDAIARGMGIDTRAMDESGGGVEYAVNGVYDYTKPFAQQIEDFRKNKIPRDDTLLVGKTPEVWKKVGFNALPVTINQTHVDYILNGSKDIDHHLGKSILKQLPQMLENPIAIIRSATKSDRVVALLKATHNGKQIVVPIEVDGYGKLNNIVIDSNSITSSLGKSNAVKQLYDAVLGKMVGTSNDLFYWNKNEAMPLLRRAGHQLSGTSPQDGLVYSIREKGSGVNLRFENVTESQQFKRFFGDWQNNPKKASKVVNDDGTPKIVYHGTNKDFTVFNSSNDTYWFSESYDYAESMAEERGSDKVMQVYLDMRKPYRAKLPEGKFSDPVAEKSIIQTAKANGHDGVIIECDTDNELVYDKFYVVFDKTQIKSATDNIGTYDKTNPDIQFSSPVASDEVENDIKISSKKAESYYNRYSNTAKKDIGKLLGIPKSRLGVIDGNIDTLAGEYFHKGKISDASKEALFEKAWKEGVVIDDSNTEFAKSLRKDLKSSTLYISPEDAKDIPDFGVWRKSQLGNMMLSTKNGYSVDSKYQELNAEYGDNYFPLNITAPSDQLLRIAEVMEKLKPVEYTLEEREGQHKEDYHKEFMKGLGEFEKRLEDVSRYEKAKELSDVQNVYGRDELTVEEANAIYDELKNARKNYEKVMAKELLTPEDAEQVDLILKGKADIDRIDPKKYNIDGIKRVTEAKAPIELLTDSLNKHRKAIKDRRYKTAEAFLEGSDLWKEKKSGWRYATETMERNFYDIMGSGKSNDKSASVSVDEYTEQEKKNWENSKDILVYETDEQFDDFLGKTLIDGRYMKKMYFGKIPMEAAKIISGETGIDVEGFNIALKSYEIRKILLNSHGDSKKEALRGQEKIEPKDLLNIPDIILNADNVRLSEKKYEGKPVLEFTKNIDGINYVIAYVSRKHHDLAIQTMYKTVDNKRSLATAKDANAPFSTSKTTNGTASEKSVSQNNKNVNNEDSSVNKATRLIDHYFTPVHEHEAEKVRNENEYLDKVAKLNLSQKIEKGNKTSESFAVQFLGEVESDLERLSKFKTNGIFNKKVGTKTRFATQQEVDRYIDYSYMYAYETNELGNKEFPKQNDGIVIGKIDDKIINELKDYTDIDLSEAYHVLRDNDVRHIKNSHGEGTSEKYPVTAEDLKQIPDIIKNYDDVLYVENGTKKGLFYVKRHNGVTYYLEAIRENGTILSNKQMIKVSTEQYQMCQD